MNLPDSLHESAMKNREKIAYYFMDDPTTYEELNVSVNKFASGLAKAGIGEGDHVALLLGNSPHFIISLYGIMRVGATAIPINPTYTPSEIAYILKDGDVKAVIALDQMIPYIEKLRMAAPKIEHYIICETGAELNAEMETFSGILHSGDADFTAVPINSGDTAVILYTSGTTGKPKGAMLTHGNLYSNARDIRDYLKMGGEDTVITTLPMFHVFSLTVVLNAPLISGSTLIILPKFSPKEIFRVAKNFKATIFAGVPTMYNFLYQYPESNPDDFSSIRLCISGGASMPVALLKNFEEKFNVVISEGYGLSEASPVTSFNPLDRPRKPGSIGTSIMNVENKVVDEAGNELPAGEVGELAVRGPNVMKGYYNMPEETSKAIRDGWLYTGDLAKMDEEGYFYIVDRKKDLIIVGGYNVYPREVEEVLYGHPGVLEAAVIGVPDADQGEAVKAFIVPRDEKVDKAELHQFLAERLASYKLPKSIEFIEELPKNSTGKIMKRELKNRILQ
ncbi:fatty acid--CoA ligase family protein [Siminovitchia fortis]|uniref:Fatty acid--CoA ligase family protein n=1 Tax=Siminovitchia fortis TaxID=254758 RepID=A0A443J2H8_9BACI|nr:fatty acid--CoA ligase family protein [Siminovitchia fortis]RWR14573.1 fatty acid--CoA ligase family protein [Siminovitchia fortis]WHY80255.1 fatty acid--CoA ligase family protein [Siminovitchia fortis]